MTILITGAAGFIGSNLADELLKQGNKVVVVDNFNDYYDVKIKEENVAHNLHNPNYKLYRLDICDKQSLRHVFEENEISAVVHLAARAGVRPSIEKPESYVETNVLGSVVLMELMKDFNVKKLVFASSSSVYGNCKESLFSEDLKVTEPISPYAAAKSAAEQFVYTYHKLYGLSAVCLRFFTVYGPRQRPDLAIRKFVEKIENNQPIQMYGNGGTMRDYTYVDDIVTGVISAIHYDKTPYEIINIGGGEPITLKRMIETIEDVLAKRAKIEVLPMQMGDVEKTICDWSKANSLLGYNPSTTFKEGIEKFVAWKNAQAKKFAA
ncbi:MAG: SDR family NAD(P)-dependent oxidoreductase [Alphaproteobacteria bacterium]|nr:SDR family NAD(P)-dependent oxidoreductase [Alphaproteobacteria bacterium]